MFKHVFFVLSGTDAQETEARWLAAELEDLEGPRPEFLQPRSYVAEFHFPETSSLLAAAQAVGYSDALIVPDVETLAAHADALFEVIPHLREKRASLKLIAPFVELNTSHRSEWLTMQVLLSVFEQARLQQAPSEPAPRPRNLPPRRKERFTPEEAQVMRRMRRGGATIPDIARRYSCSVALVHRLVKGEKILVTRRLKSGGVGLLEVIERKVAHIAEKDSELYEALRAFVGSYAVIASAQRACNDLKAFFIFLMKKGARTDLAPRDVSQEDLSSFLLSLQERGSSSNRLGNVYYLLRRFFEFCVAKGFADESPMAHMNAPRIARSTVVRSEDLTEQELERMAAYLTRQVTLADRRREPITYFRALRRLVIIMVLTSTGLRVNEVLRLRLKDLSEKDGDFIISTRGKFGNSIVSRVPEHVSLLLGNYLKLYKSSLDKNSYVFTSEMESEKPMLSICVLRSLQKAAQRVGIERNITTHSLRVTFATLAAKRGMPLKELQERLGHSKMEQTIAYVRRTNALSQNEYLPSCIAQGCQEVNRILEEDGHGRYGQAGLRGENRESRRGKDAACEAPGG